MNSLLRLMKTWSFLFLLFSFPVPTISQQPHSLSEAELVSTAREIMATARYCALITFDGNTRVGVRTVDPFAPEENMIVWIATNPRTRKVAQIRRNPRVTLYYFDRGGQAYVTLYGRARLVSDPKEKAKRWKDEWKGFYPDRGKSYLLIKVTPEKMEVISVAKGITGDPQTWQPPSVRFPSGPSTRR